MTTTLTPQILGQTEKALNALLGRHLAGTGVSEPQWVTLTLAVMSAEAVPQDEFVARVMDGLKVSADVARSHVAALQAAQLLEPGEGAPIKASDAGEQLHGRIRAENAALIQRMWGDLSAEDLDTTGRVLATILDRANAELASN